MPIIKSISGFRGTIGGSPGQNLTPIDIVESSAAFGAWLLERTEEAVVVIGRDARISGKMVAQLCANTLVAVGIDVIDIGLSTTPTVEMAIIKYGAQGGIVVTASHNPKEWNALKLLNHKGEFISAEEGAKILEISASLQFTFAGVDQMGSYEKRKNLIQHHVDEVIALPYVDIAAVSGKKFSVIVDAVNSTGAISIPPLLDKMGVAYTVINGDVSGDFAHNPEPLPEHLTHLSEFVKAEGADLGIAVDPDVDRVAFVCEDGTFFGEEYSLVAIADYILQKNPGPTVSNLSSSRALRDITLRRGCTYHTAEVGEVNVVRKMKEVDAVIGGEGNGGIIYPALHYGRDALVGIALMLSHLSTSGLKMSELKNSYPRYCLLKTKIQLTDGLDVDLLLQKVAEQFTDQDVDRRDGVKIDFAESWVHLRKSNTEPIVRIYAEAKDESSATRLIEDIQDVISSYR